MLEVEAKVRVPDLAVMRQTLQALGASVGATQEQDDTFFRHPARDLVASDEALRLRRVGTTFELTYKGPRLAERGAKARIEHTIHIAEDPTTVLAALGFEPSARLQKRREPWHLGAVEVALDHIEGLGSFVEVEVQGDDVVAARSLVAATLRQLGLDEEPVVPQSYIEMALRAGVSQALH